MQMELGLEKSFQSEILPAITVALRGCQRPIDAAEVLHAGSWRDAGRRRCGVDCASGCLAANNGDADMDVSRIRNRSDIQRVSRLHSVAIGHDVTDERDGKDVHQACG